MNAALAFRDGDALHAVNPRLPAHRTESALALDLEYRFFHTAKRAVGLRYHLDAPPPSFGKSSVHAKEIRGKYRGFITTGATSDLDDGGPVVERIMWNKRRFYLLEQRLDGCFETCRFGFCFLRHLGVIRFGELAGFRELLLESLQLVPHFDQRVEMPQLPAQRGHTLLVPYRLRIGEFSLYLRGTLNGVPEPVAETQLSVLGAAAGLPYF
jgi:hypothetical protein